MLRGWVRHWLLICQSFRLPISVGKWFKLRYVLFSKRQPENVWECVFRLPLLPKNRAEWRAIKWAGEEPVIVVVKHFYAF